MERDTMPVDVLLVGAGPANLACAYRLAQVLQEKGKLDEHVIMIVEKGREVGDHILSGAIMDPKAMSELFGDDWRAQGCPVDADVAEESVFTLTATKARKMAFIPPPLKNHGNVIVSLSHVVRWMKEKVEAFGDAIMIAEEQPAADVLLDGERVTGARLVDRGREKDGAEGAAFEPGADIEARITVLGEGSRGSLTKILVDKLGLGGTNPQVYGTGVKEIWDIPEGRVTAGTVWHTAGWPLPDTTYGGSWMYAMSDSRVSVGFVTALDGGDPGCDPFEIMQRWKTHPQLRTLLDGGTLVKSGSKTVPEGGWWSRPKSFGDGFLIVGDSGSLLNIARLKGIHTALRSGMIAGEVIAEALLADDTSAGVLERYEERLRASWVKDELWRVRNWRQIFSAKGFKKGKLFAGLAWALGGKILKDPVPIHDDAQSVSPGDASAGRDFKVEEGLTIDKVTGVFHAGSIHEENQPSHLLIADTDLCASRCAEEYGNPCERFCPAAVYEMVDGAMQINFSNCVHCKTCDIADPYGVITWTVPEDNGGPRYLGM
ncbi:MAG: electron transfer flavoprotein [Planctomycetes bacterium]|nr:electron transfer flavoprotein [Planctomycetota bacterium]